jgi:hypothetical protein
MIHRRNRAGFDLKPFGKFAGQQLDRDDAAKARVGRLAL